MGRSTPEAFNAKAIFLRSRNLVINEWFLIDGKLITDGSTSDSGNSSPFKN